METILEVLQALTLIVSIVRGTLDLIGEVQRRWWENKHSRMT